MQFWDMNVYPFDFSKPEINEIELQKLIQCIQQEGYCGFALNYSPQFLQQGNAMKKLTMLDPESVKYPRTLEIQNVRLSQLSKLKFPLKRVSLEIEQSSQLQILSQQAIQKFDIVSVNTSDEKIFNYLVQSNEIDIINLDYFLRKLPFGINHKLYKNLKQAQKNKITFEFSYSQALKGGDRRKFFLSNVMEIMNLLKGKSVIFSSGAQSEIEHRGPYDIINLLEIFGLSQDKTRKCISDNVIQMLKHADSRKVYKSVINVVTEEELSKTMV